jgi:hypothetical protein
VKRALILLAACLPLFACKPQDNTATTPADNGKGAFRTICKDDIAKFCATENKVRRCLKQNSDKLSDACKQAVAKKKNGKKKNKNKNKDQDTDE